MNTQDLIKLARQARSEDDLNRLFREMRRSGYPRQQGDYARIRLNTQYRGTRIRAITLVREGIRCLTHGQRITLKEAKDLYDRIASGWTIVVPLDKFNLDGIASVEAEFVDTADTSEFLWMNSTR